MAFGFKEIHAQIIAHPDSKEWNDRAINQAFDDKPPRITPEEKKKLSILSEQVNTIFEGYEEAMDYFDKYYAKEYDIKISLVDILIEHKTIGKTYVDATFNRKDCYIQSIVSGKEGQGTQLMKILKEIAKILGFATISGHVTSESAYYLRVKSWPANKIKFYRRGTGVEVTRSEADQLIKTQGEIEIVGYL